MFKDVLVKFDLFLISVLQEITLKLHYTKVLQHIRLIYFASFVYLSCIKLAKKSCQTKKRNFSSSSLFWDKIDLKAKIYFMRFFMKK